MDRIYSNTEADEFRQLFKGYMPNKFIVEDDKVSIASDSAQDVPPVMLFFRHEETQNWYRNVDIKSYDLNIFLKNALRQFEKEGKELSAQGLADFLKETMDSVGLGRNYSSF